MGIIYLKLLKSRTAQNLAALFGVQMANYVLPLLTLPYLARVLGPEGWGLLAIVQSYSQYLSLLVEYGFTMSATRDVAHHRDNPAKLAELLAGVSGAKLVLGATAVVLTLLVSGWVSNLNQNSALLWSGVLWGIALAFSPVWYFQGQERLRRVALLEISTKLVALVFIFALVRAPADAWLVLFIQGVASVAASGIALSLAYREVGFVWPRPKLVEDALRSGWSLFFARAVACSYTMANPFILGLFAPPQLVAYYAGAERLTKAFLGLLEPINRTFFPRLSHLIGHSYPQAGQLAGRVTQVMGLGGLFFAGLVALIAPWIVWLLLGSDFTQAVPIMRILVVLLPMMALSNALGIQWMLALRLDWSFNRIILGAGLLNPILVLWLVPQLAHFGMAYTVVLVELFVVGAIAVYLLRSRQSPWQVGRKSL